MRKYFLFTILSALSLTPLLSFGSIWPLVQCYGPGSRDIMYQACDFTAFIQLINRFISYAIFLAFPIVACIFAYAGFLLITEGGSPDTIKKAWGYIKDAGLGFGIMLLGWVFVKFILDNLLTGSSYKGAFQTLFTGH